MRSKQITAAQDCRLHDGSTIVIDQVLRLDEKLTGRPHAAYYESKCDAYIKRAPDICLVAEHRNHVVGFVRGEYVNLVRRLNDAGPT